MPFVYHGVPEQMVGNKLIPLNDMPDFMAEIRDVHLSKYQGREEVLERRIPLLDCLWNDVVQFLPLHPRKVFELQVQMGLIPEVPPYRFFEINVETLDSTKTVVFFKHAPGDESSSVKWLNDVKLESLQEIPQATIDYYQTLVGTDELPFNYQFVPHVVSKDTIDVSGSNIITL